jgi:hypothetical protein
LDNDEADGAAAAATAAIPVLALEKENFFEWLVLLLLLLVRTPLVGAGDEATEPAADVDVLDCRACACHCGCW